MVVGFGVGEAEADDDFIQEWGIRELVAHAAEVSAHREDKLVAAGEEAIGGEERLIGAAVLVGDGGFEEAGRFTVEQGETD